MKKLQVVVNATPTYQADQSSSSLHNYIWIYDITITNNSKEIVQLLTRHWRITDGNGEVAEVEGAGVVGLQPLLKPGMTFSYQSFCQLNTADGTMEGYYVMQTLDDEAVIVEIPRFYLIVPDDDAKGDKHLH